MLILENFVYKGTRRFLFLSLLLILGLMFAACGGVDAGERLAEEPPAITADDPAVEEQTVEEAPLAEEAQTAETVMEDETAPGSTGELVAVRASGLMDNNLVSNAMDDLGKVEDIIIDLKGHASYAVLSPEETRQVDSDEMLVLPLAALRYDSEQETFFFAGDNETFQAAPRLVGGTRPDFDDPTWDQQLAEFWNNTGEGTLIPETGDTTATTLTGPNSVLASDLLGDFVISETGEPVGRVEDVIVSVRPDAVDYAVLSFTGYTSVVDRFFAIPINQLVLTDVDQDMVSFNVEEEILQDAPGFDPDDFPNINFPEWDSEFLMFWESAAIGAASGMGQLGAPAAPSSGVAGPVAPIADEYALSVSELLNYRVAGARGEDLGQVEDLIMGLDSKSVLYAVFTLEGLPGSGDEFIPVPLAMTSIDTEEQLFIFNADPVIVAAAPRFNRDNWPDLSQTDWGENLWQFWAGPAVIMAPPGAAPIPAPVPGEGLEDDPAVAEIMPGVDEPGVRLSELLGYSVVNTQGQNLGQVEDLILDVETQRVNYMLLAIDASANIDSELMPIPWLALDLNPENQTFVLDAPDQVLRNAPGFNRADWGTGTTDRDWDAAVQDFWRNPAATR